MNGNNPANTAVFISYAREDSDSAERLYNELKNAGFKPWLDKHNVIAGQDWKKEIRNAIENSRYFVPLFSSSSVKKIGYIQNEFKYALEVFERYPPGIIFYIPVRLDDCDIPYDELDSIQRVDLFPDSKWKEGVNSIIRALRFDQNNYKDKDDENKDADNNLTTTNDDTISSSLSSLLIQKPSLFRGEKSFFVGREEYINKIIKEQIKVPSSRVCIVGPGGSGKSQLAFKAIHQYEKEGLFDLVVPIYFSDVASMSFSDFLLNIANSFDVNERGKFEKMNIEQRKTEIQKFLSQRKKHALIFLDNYETVVSHILYDERQITTQQYEDAVNISNYLNNELPSNTSVLVTSRERSNKMGNKERRIDLAGLQEQESIKLFSGLTSEDYLKDIENIIANPTVKKIINKIFNMTGGHPLSIEIIAKNISSIYELDDMIDTPGIGKINIDEPDKRLRSLEACFNYTINKTSRKN
jgi:hypothetical protein